MITSILVSALAYASAVSAHGYVASVQANGQNYNGYNPANSPWQPDQVCIHVTTSTPQSGLSCSITILTLDNSKVSPGRTLPPTSASSHPTPLEAPRSPATVAQATPSCTPLSPLAAKSLCAGTPGPTHTRAPSWTTSRPATASAPMWTRTLSSSSRLPRRVKFRWVLATARLVTLVLPNLAS